MELYYPISQWYETQARDLPWRSADRSPWGVLVSEVMLQQTPVQRVLPVWQQWLQRWPTPTSLADEPSGEAIRAWGRLGYPRRAVRLHQAAGQIRDRHHGEVPAEHEQLLALAGVGEYTAAAVASFAFGARHAVIDTNVRRVFARCVQGQGQAAASLTAVERKLARSLLPQSPADAAHWGVAVMELGALICTARSPKCEQCPIRTQCQWLRAGSPEYAGPVRKSQGWAGTDRQVRGKILAALRSAAAPIPATAIAQLLPPHTLVDPNQVDRCLNSLTEDALIAGNSQQGFRLPS